MKKAHKCFSEESWPDAERMRKLLSMSVDCSFLKRSSTVNLKVGEDYPVDRCLYLHACALRAIQKTQFQEALAHEMACLKTFKASVLEKCKEENWFLPILYQMCSNVRHVACLADKHSRLPFCDEQQDGSFMEQAAAAILACYRICISDRNVPLEVTKRVGTLNLTNTLFRIYFAMNQWNNLVPLIQTVARCEDVMDRFSVADKVTYNYFVGRKALDDSDFEVADNCLSYAFRNCPEKFFKNRRIILMHLIPVKIFRGQMPCKSLLDKYQLTIFEPIVAAVKLGDVGAFERIMSANTGTFMSACYLFLLKLKMVCFRNLFKKVCLICAHHQVPIESFAAAAKMTRCKDSCPEAVECILVNLIYGGQVKGYISHQNQVVVLSRKNPFPHLAETKWTY
uniref:CSN12-like protein n=1 Tax=Trichuris muris TaxID=70415 RepID=A0A5S6QNI3_TRIMR